MQDDCVTRAIHERRSIKEYTDRPVPREELEALLEAAVQAPNHRMTEPWHFLVLGPEAKAAYAEALAGRKARKIDDASAAEAVREKVVRRTTAVPAMVAVVMDQAEDPEVREEDFASCYMAVQNLSLAALERGLGTHIKSGAVMDDPALRGPLGVPDHRRVVCIVFVGEPAAVPEAPARRPAAERTAWLD